MIWIIVAAFILADVKLNAWLINGGYKIYHWLNAIYRTVFYGGLVWAYGMEWKEVLMFLLGAFFLHSLLFNVGLNYLRQLPIDYLGKDSVLDRLEAKIPWIVAFVWKVIAASGFIYGYYNVNLL